MDPLWKIDDRISRIIEADGNLVDPETGEVVDLDALQMERKEKIENIIKAIQRFKAQCVALDAAIKDMSSRADAKKKKMEWLKSYLAHHMKYGEKFECTAGEVRWDKKIITVVDCAPEMLPEEFTRVKVTIEPKKDDLKKALKEGKVIEGVRLEDRTSIYIR